MDNEYLLKLVKNENLDFSSHNETAFIAFSHNDLGGTSSYQIDYCIAKGIGVGSFYKDKDHSLYQILGKLHDSKNNIILLCKKI